MARRRSNSARSSSPKPDITAGGSAGAAPAPPSDFARKTIVVLMLVVGMEFWLYAAAYPGSLLQLALIGMAIAAGFVPVVRVRVSALLDRLRSPSPRARRLAGVGIAVASTAYLLLTAASQRRDFFPVVHDEFSYLISARMLAAGHLWMAAHPLKYVFDSFQLLVEPVYASAYFSGVALLYAPAMLLHVPVWVVSAGVSGAVVGVTYRIVTELTDGVCGALAAFMLLAVRIFRILSIMTMANTPALLMGLVLIWAWLRWRKSDAKAGVGWAVLMGIAAGWAAITRPLDAICFALPVGVAILADLASQKRQRWVVTATALVLGAAPLLSVQLVANRGITGDWLTTPFRLYADRDYPGSALGFHPPPTAAPRSPLPQKQLAYAEALHAIGEHTPANLPRHLLQKMSQTFVLAAPQLLMLVLVPAGLIGLAGRGRWVFFCVLPLFLGLYTLYVFFLYHYTIIVAPAVVLLILFGARAVAQTFPAGGRTAVLLFLGLAMMTATNLPEMGMVQRDSMFDAPMLADVNRQLAAISDPAVVLFRYDPKRDIHEEPVFNVEAAWPDDAKIVRAHDLGPASNLTVARYYAGIGQNRAIYRYDEATRSLTRLGTAAELVAAGKAF